MSKGSLTSDNASFALLVSTVVGVRRLAWASDFYRGISSACAASTAWSGDPPRNCPVARGIGALMLHVFDDCAKFWQGLTSVWVIQKNSWRCGGEGVRPSPALS